MATPYYVDDFVTIYHADSLKPVQCPDPEFSDLMVPLATTFGGDLLVTDPPYGIGWKRGVNKARSSKAHAGIANDDSTAARDEILDWWEDRPAVVFGSLAAPLPPRHVQTLIWHKPPDAGVVGSVTGFRRDVEAIYLCGRIPKRTVERSSVLRSTIPNIGSPSSPAGRWGHPHAKPVDLMCDLIGLAPGTVLDPFMGSGSTLVAAKLLSRKAVGIEIEERYCEMAARRCAQEALDLEAA